MQRRHRAGAMWVDMEGLISKRADTTCTRTSTWTQKFKCSASVPLQFHITPARWASYCITSTKVHCMYGCFACKSAALHCASGAVLAYHLGH